MEIEQFHLDAFSEKLFAGNPAAVCPLYNWLADETMQAIAAENNLSETAFFVPQGNTFQIRWFTPLVEVALCGHATLASAYVIFNNLNHGSDLVEFSSRSGPLYVRKTEKGLTLDFPVQEISAIELNDNLSDALDCMPIEVLSGEDLVAVYAQQSDIENFQPDFLKLSKLPYRGIIITAPGDNHDFVCRFFAPAKGVPEDPVTGSVYTKITSYWAKELGKVSMLAKQLSHRGGLVQVELLGNRVLISGHVKLFSRGVIFLD